MKRTHILSAAALAIVVATPASAATIVNADFNNGFGSFTVSPGAAIDRVVGSDYGPCCGATGSSANLSNPFVTFGSGERPTNGVLSTTFRTVVGQLYTLSYQYAVLGGGSQSLDVLINGVLSERATKNADNNFDGNFIGVGSYFIARSALTTLGFTTAGGGNGVDVGLDNVQVSGMAAVPEPATWAMMLLGFGMVGFGMRRRKSKVTTNVSFV